MKNTACQKCAEEANKELAERTDKDPRYTTRLFPHIRTVMLEVTRDWARPCPHLHRDWVHGFHICTGTGLAPAHICTGTGLASTTSASGLGSPLQRLHWARPCHICTGTGLDRAAKPHSRRRACVNRPHFHWRKDASMPPCEHSIPAFF